MYCLWFAFIWQIYLHAQTLRIPKEYRKRKVEGRCNNWKGHPLFFNVQNFENLARRRHTSIPIYHPYRTLTTSEQTLLENTKKQEYFLQVWILCNDCNDTTEVYFHIIGQKCSHCESYNTRTIAPPVLPQWVNDHTITEIYPGRQAYWKLAPYGFLNRRGYLIACSIILNCHPS